MSHRMAKVDKHIQRTVSLIVAKEGLLPQDILVTVSGVETTSNLTVARVWLSVLPEDKAGAVLEALQSNIFMIQGEFNKAVYLKPLPKLKFQIDHGVAHADSINKIFQESEGLLSDN